jgi:hypothetical protein
MLELNHTEALILMRLVKQGCLSKEQACAITARNNQPVMTGLRKKLRACGVALTTVYQFGWEICRKDRETIRELLTTLADKQIPGCLRRRASAKTRPRVG